MLSLYTVHYNTRKVVWLLIPGPCYTVIQWGGTVHKRVAVIIFKQKGIWKRLNNIGGEGVNSLAVVDFWCKPEHCLSAPYLNQHIKFKIK